MTDEATTPKANGNATQLGRLESLLRENGNKSHPPVHLWNPEERPDIGLAIERDGTWTHQSSPFTRPALVKLFSGVLRHDGDNRYFLVTPVEKVPIRVADAPFLAVELEVRGTGKSQELIWRTNVDDVVKTDADHPLRFAAETPTNGPKPYVLVRGGLEALVTRALYYDLVNYAETAVIDGIEQFGIWSCGTFFPMAAAADLMAENNA